MEKATVLIIDRENSPLEKGLAKEAGLSVLGSTSNVDIGFTMAERYEPTLILLNIDLVGEAAFSAAEAFALEFPAASLVLLSQSEDPQVLHQALKLGAKDVISLPVDEESLSTSINQVLKRDRRRRQLFSQEKKKKPQFKVITVFNTKGGVGKTTIALNLALAIQNMSKGRVVLVDLDLFSGNVALMAGIDLRLTIKDMVDDISILSKESLDDYCVRHPAGLHIVPAPWNPEAAGFINSEHVEKILRLLSETFNYVIIDAPTYFSDPLMPALEMAQDIVLVSTLDLAAGQNLKQCLDLLDRLNMKNKAQLVLNRVSNTGLLKAKDLEKQLGLNVLLEIPECQKEAVDAINLGEPLLLSAGSAACSQKIRSLADLLISEGEKSKRFHLGLLGR